MSMDKYMELYSMGLSVAEIAKELDCSRQNVYQNLKDNGITFERTAKKQDENTPKKEKRVRKTYDHKKNEFDSLEDMCNFWGVTRDQFKQRRYVYKWTLEESLEGRVLDHKGNRYFTVEEMLNAWNVNKNTFYMRKRKGWTLKECLEGKDRKVGVLDEREADGE